MSQSGNREQVVHELACRLLIARDFDEPVSNAVEDVQQMMGVRITPTEIGAAIMLSNEEYAKGDN